MTNERLYTISRAAASWELDVDMQIEDPCMPARGPSEGTLVVFGSDGKHDASGAALVRPRYLLEVPSASGGQGPVRPVSSPVAIASVASGGCSLLPQVLRYGSGAMGFLLFNLEGDVFRFRDEDILLPEQVWQPPQWDLCGGDPGMVTFIFTEPQETERKAHIYVLRRYEYFRRLLDGWSEGQTRTVMIQDVEVSIFEQLLGYLYSGSLDSKLSMPDLAALLSAANRYLIADLAVAALRRLQRALRASCPVRAASGEALARVLSTAEAVGGDGAALLQDAIEAVLVHRTELLEDEAFLSQLTRNSPAALRALLAAFRACATLDRATVRWRRECGALGPPSRTVRPQWLAISGTRRPRQAGLDEEVGHVPQMLPVVRLAHRGSCSGPEGAAASAMVSSGGATADAGFGTSRATTINA